MRINLKDIVMFLLVAVGLYAIYAHESPVDILMKPYEVNTGSEGGILKVKFEGDSYDVSTEIVPGRITIIYLYSDSCPGCKRLNKNLGDLVATRPDVAVRKFDLGKKWTGYTAYNKYKLRVYSTPFIQIFDHNGNLIIEDNDTNKDGFKLLLEWMNAELKKKRADNERRKAL